VMQKVFHVNSKLFWGYYCNFCLVCSFEIVFCIVDVKTKKKRKKKKYSEGVCVCLYIYIFFLWMFFFIIHDKIAKIKEEFNILICSRIKNYELTCKSYF